MSLNFNFSSKNFLLTPKGKDKFFRIRNKDNKTVYSILPHKSYFYYRERFVYIRQDGSNNITLDFANENEAIIALKKLNDMKSFFLKTESEVREYYTKQELDNGQLNNQYVNKDGDSMTGDLQIVTLSNQSGITQSINVNELGKLIQGNQYLIRKEDLDSPTMVDHFHKNLDYSVFWEYAIKNGQNIRAGSIIGAWDDISNEISFTHISTMDIGNTEGIDFRVDMDNGGTIIRLFAIITGGNWKIKVLRRFI